MADRVRVRVLAWARVGPPLARVDHLDLVDEPPEGLSSFRIAATW